MFVLSHSVLSNSLRPPWTVAHQAPLSMGFSRQEYWSGLPFTPPRGFLDPGIKPTSLASPALAARFFTTSATWEAPSGLAPFMYNRGRGGWIASLTHGHEFEQTPGNVERQGGLACGSPWGHKESDTTERLNNNKCTCWLSVCLLWKVSLQVICPFKIGLLLLLLLFLLLSCMSSLYILDLHALSDIALQIFSPVQ